MRTRFLASLIVCVALLTQLGASFWGAAAARDGYAGCHRQIAAFLAIDAQSVDGAQTSGAPTGMPAQHDHASCSLCQLSFAAIGAQAPVLPVRTIRLHWRVAILPADAPALLSVFNRSAPARAPPFRV